MCLSIIVSMRAYTNLRKFYAYIDSFGHQSCQLPMIYDPVTENCEDCAVICSGPQFASNPLICNQCAGKVNKIPLSLTILCKTTTVTSTVKYAMQCTFRLHRRVTNLYMA